MSQQQICSIGELANEFDITTRSVRFYEDRGLLIPYRRGNTRIFDDKCRARLKLILRNKRMGFSLSEIKDLFDLWDAAIPGGNEKQLLLMLDTLARKRAQLEQQKNDIAQAEMEMDTAEARCREALADLQARKRKQTKATTKEPESIDQK
ncbi:MerR family transcriptional regulator [Marinobacter sp.]|uniref:MerR family transcriptional regulator n=1 Tax=Marinobacter sp. TaxID=50741 RepID=UPI003BADAB22